ncbi:MAG: methyltransferase domain-containing protein [Thermoanaerobaculia bacterium]
MPKPTEPVPAYLFPYHDARQHGAKGIDALLWTSRAGQRIRFDVIARICPLAGKRILDVGCGRADLLGHLLARGIVPAHYTGMEMIPATLRSARRQGYENCAIVATDFVREPEKLKVGADVVIFSGSLNTLASSQFYGALRAAWAAAGQWLVFNFLSSKYWCGEEWIHWHRRQTVLDFCRSLGGEPRFECGYLTGDCTIAVKKPGGAE